MSVLLSLALSELEVLYLPARRTLARDIDPTVTAPGTRAGETVLTSTFEKPNHT
jgi:hypothetical protein